MSLEERGSLIVTDSILNSVKQLLGISEDNTDFDVNVITYINSVFMILNQMGVGPDIPFVISDETSTWHDFSDEINTMESVKAYVPLKVKIMFDPPTSSATMDALKYIISEHEWRLNVLCDNTFQEGLA